MTQTCPSKTSLQTIKNYFGFMNQKISADDLRAHLLETLYYERRQPGLVRFYDNSKKHIGRQALGNGLGHAFKEIDEAFTINESDDTIRLKLKKSLGFLNHNPRSNICPQVPDKPQPPDKRERH